VHYFVLGSFLIDNSRDKNNGAMLNISRYMFVSEFGKNSCYESQIIMGMLCLKGLRSANKKETHNLAVLMSISVI
jgi:hypothetical protein